MRIIKLKLLSKKTIIDFNKFKKLNLIKMTKFYVLLTMMDELLKKKIFIVPHQMNYN